MWCSQSDDHPKNHFAKFGYILDMKVRKKNRIVLYSWLPTGTFHNNLVMWKKYSSNFGLKIQNMLNIKSRNKEINENEKKSYNLCLTKNIIVDFQSSIWELT